jgi:hypothetical protein
MRHGINTVENRNHGLVPGAIHRLSRKLPAGAFDSHARGREGCRVRGVAIDRLAGELPLRILSDARFGKERHAVPQERR